MKKDRKRRYFLSHYLLISVFLLMEGTLFPLYAVNSHGTNEKRAVQTVKEVLEISPVSQQQENQIKVTGQVIDEIGEPVPGANVTVKGHSGLGTVTDSEGNFTLNIPRDAVLIVSFIGYIPAEQTVRNTNKVVIRLVPDAKALEEVVITAFGTGQKKESVVGSIQTVRPADLKVPASNLSNSFAGRMAGGVAFQRSGQPGSNGSDFYIRGISTLSGITSPLIIIDGVEVSKADLNALDPEVIDNFSILKDATATAMYGTRGANGVLIIATKSGADTERPIISFRLEGNVAQPTSIPQFADAVTYMNMYNEAATNQFGNAATGLFTQDQINGTINGANPYIYPNVDWYNELFK